MKLAIVGTQVLDSYTRFKGRLKYNFDAFSDVTEIVTGGTERIGYFAERLANSLEIPIKKFPPDYKTYGSNAPLVRNTQLVEYADYVIVFIDEYSRGTYDYIKKAKAANKPLNVITLNDEEEVLESWISEGLCEPGYEHRMEEARINGYTEIHVPTPNYRIMIQKKGLGYRPEEGGYFHYRKDAERIKLLLEASLPPENTIIKIETLPDKNYEFKEFD